MKRLLCTILAAVAMSATTVNAVAQKPDLLEIIEMTGEIHEGSARAIAEQVEAINETPKVKAVPLVVDSPGGGVMPSAVIYEELSKLPPYWARPTTLPTTCEQLASLRVPALVVIGENTRANFRYGNETLIGCLLKTTATAIIPGAPHTWYAVNPAGARAVLAFISQH